MDDLTIVDTYQYDRALVWYAAWVRTGNAKFWDRGTHTASEYRRISVDADYQWQPHFQETQGLEIHYLLTGDERSRHTVEEIAKFLDMAYRPYIDRDPLKDWMDPRIQTRVLLSALLAWRLDVGGRDWGAQVREDLDEILATQGPDGALRWISWEGEHCVFMGSLLIHAMIKYYTWFEPDERIPPFIKGVLDFVHPSLWLGDSWQYTTADAQHTVDLNQLNAVGYAWYGWYSGDSRYTEIAETAFAKAVSGAWLDGMKQFNQNYRSAYATAYYILSRRSGSG